MSEDANPTFKAPYVSIPRGRIVVAGEDRHDFLQALVSNDLALLKTQEAIYACLLTPQGKFLHDFFIVTMGDELWIDCEGGARAVDLHRRLSLYRLRSKVTLTLIENTEIYATLSPGGWPDPRHSQMGARAFTKPDSAEQDFSIWDMARIALCIPDGSRDMVIEQSTPIECNLDRLNAISFTKGCYVGQELTARMHHRGLAKRHLYSVIWQDTSPAPGTDILSPEGVVIGTARSSCGQSGLVTLKDEYASRPHPDFTVNNVGQP